MWLIEATDEQGNVKLIGHHGVMPIAFSNGETDLLFGKTENTMVLPEYRKKILYLDLKKIYQSISKPLRCLVLDHGASSSNTSA